MPQTGLLDIDARELHDSVSTAAASDGRLTQRSLARAGYHAPQGLHMRCNLGGVVYAISGEREASSNQTCGGAPDMRLTVTRNGAPLLTRVTFGSSCTEQASLMSITIGDGRQSWRGRETQACFALGGPSDTRHCRWTFGAEREFAQHYPMDDAAIERLAAPLRQAR